jgi:hypothetical protein
MLILAAIGVFVPDAQNPWLGRSRWIVVLILFAILGLHVFGNPAK